MIRTGTVSKRLYTKETVCLSGSWPPLQTTPSPLIRREEKKDQACIEGEKLESLRQKSRYKFLIGHADEVINLKPKSGRNCLRLKVSVEAPSSNLARL